MDRIILFHGSTKIVTSPYYGGGDSCSDYGNGFYCTRDLNAAKEWANKKTSHGFANKYSFDGRGLKILDLTDKSKYSVLHWISILMHYRELSPAFKEDYQRELEYLDKHYYINISDYDVVIGFRADDSYFTFPLMFVEGEIRLERLEDIYHLGYLGEQVAIISEKAYTRLSFIEAREVEPIYKEKYATRIAVADSRFKEIAKSEKWLKGTRIKDLVSKDDKGQ